MGPTLSDLIEDLCVELGIFADKDNKASIKKAIAKVQANKRQKDTTAQFIKGIKNNCENFLKD